MLPPEAAEDTIVDGKGNRYPTGVEHIIWLLKIVIINYDTLLFAPSVIHYIAVKNYPSRRNHDFRIKNWDFP